MAFKQTYDGEDVIAAIGAHINTQLVSNASDAVEPWDDHSLTVVDGQLTIITDTDDLVGVRFIVANDVIGDSELTDTDPTAEDSMVWYSFYAARGPLVFRLISKKTVHPDNKLWLQTWKARGASNTAIRWGLNLMIQAHQT